MSLVVTVSGAVGGIGASTLAYALALQSNSKAVLIDAQAGGAPIDLLTGGEKLEGVRWSQVRIRSDEIAAETICAALPLRHGVRLLSADREGMADAAAVQHLVESLRRDEVPVVIDAPARSTLRAVLRPDLDVLLVPPTLHGICAASYVLNDDTQVVVVDIGRADVSLDSVREYLGHPTQGQIRWQFAVTTAAIAGTRLPRATDVMRVASKLLESVRHAV